MSTEEREYAWKLTDEEIAQWPRLTEAEKSLKEPDLCFQDIKKLVEAGHMTHGHWEKLLDGRFEDLMKSFGIDAKKIRQLLKAFKACISGSVPLAIMYPNRFTPNDIDIFSDERNTEGLLHELLQDGWYMARAFLWRDADAIQVAKDKKPEEYVECQCEHQTINPNAQRASPSPYRNQWDEYHAPFDQEKLEEAHHTLATPFPEQGDPTPEKEHPYAELHGIKQIYEMRRKGDGLKINIIETKGRPVAAILQFHSTIVMNYIAWHGLVVTYPETTLRRVGIINYAREPPADIEKALEKYEDRGFAFTNALRHKGEVCGVWKGCPQTIRTLHDSYCLHIRFPERTLKGIPHEKIRRNEDAYFLLWRLAGGRWCRRTGVDTTGFVVCNDEVTYGYGRRPM